MHDFNPLGLGFGLIFIVIGLVGTIFWIWMLIDCLTRRSLQTGERIVWVIVILFTHLLGALLYFFIGRSK